MKREYIGMLFMCIVLIVTLTAYYIFDEAIVSDYISKFIIIWIILGYNVGQYSMKYPKAF